MCREYEPDDLLDALRRDGPRLVADYFRTSPGYDRAIRHAVGSNTFRGFPGQRPAEVFRTWARDNMTVGDIYDLGEVDGQPAFDRLLARHVVSLSRHWVGQTRRELAIGPGRKLVNLLLKSVVRELPPADRKRIIPLLHVPHDRFCLAAVRLSAGSDRFGPRLVIPPDATMGFITSETQYEGFQEVLRGISREAIVPPIAIDLLAWDYAHPR